MLRGYRLLPMFLVLAFIAIPATSYAAQSAINLGTTSTFAVLAGTTITNTGSTEIVGSAGGDMGIYPGADSSGLQDVIASESASLLGAEAKAAQKDLVVAYDDAARRSPATRISTHLGGKTLTPGVYDSASGKFELTGTLTLDAQGDPDGVFIFLTKSTLVTGPKSMIDTISSARYSRVFWKIGSSATLGAGSHFAGHLFALTTIEAQKGATIQGQLLSKEGEVILNNNKIINGLSTTIHTSSVTGAELSETKAPSTPTTSKTPWYNMLMSVVGVAIAGFVIWSYRWRSEYNKRNLV